jgi:hypothetical protein
MRTSPAPNIDYSRSMAIGTQWDVMTTIAALDAAIERVITYNLAIRGRLTGSTRYVQTDPPSLTAGTLRNVSACSMTKFALIIVLFRPTVRVPTAAAFVTAAAAA